MAATTITATGATAYVVPAGVISVLCECWGAQGGGPVGGKGQYTKAIIGVSPGETLWANVGGQDGTNGGGSGGPVSSAHANNGTGTVGHPGGGASDVRQGGNQVNNMAVAAAGGGGTGGVGGGAPAGAGYGAAGGAIGPPGTLAGPGGGSLGGGQGGGGAIGQTPGVAGTNGGTNDLSPGPGQPPAPILAGGQGGSGGNPSSSVASANNATGGGGGGGGGGYVGGGGGGGGGGDDTAPASFGAGGGGGAGGTGYASPRAVGVVMTAGIRAGGGQVQFTPNPPGQPVLLSPSDGATLDSLAGFTETWATVLVAGQVEAMVAYRRRIAGAASYEWWSVASGGWQAAEVFNAQTATAMSWSAGAWPDGPTYRWSIAVTDSNGVAGAYSPELTFTAQAAPEVTVGAPTGTQATQTATVAWSALLAPGAAQQSYQVKVFSVPATQVSGFSPGGSVADGWDSGPVYGPGAQANTPVVAQGAWVAYVQVVQSGNQPSAWASSAFTVAVAAPAAPTVTAVSGAGSLTSVAVAVAAPGAPAGATILVESSDDSGSTWQTVRGAGALPATNGAAAVIDWESTPGTARIYRAQVQTGGASNLAVSGWSPLATATVTAIWWQLKDPANPDAGMVAPVDSFVPTDDDRQALYKIAGSENPVILSDVIGADTIALSFTFVDEASYTAFVALRGTQRTLLLQSPYQGQWYVRLGAAFAKPLMLASVIGGAPPVRQAVTGAAQIVAQP